MVNKKIFNFQEIETLNTAETTPDSLSAKEKLELTYFKNSISPDSKMARELHEASV